MAARGEDTATVAARIEADIRKGDIKPVYLLFGKEHFYIDRICDLLTESVIPPEERDFGQMVYYGVDVAAPQIISLARQYPMMVSRQMIVIKEAQGMKSVEEIAPYLENIMPTTVLVICYKTPNDGSSSKNIDKRKKLYKETLAKGVVLESEPVKDWNLAGWIESYVRGEGIEMERSCPQLMAEACGNNLSKIALEVEKLKKNLGESSTITQAMVEQNVGISRDWSAFELTNAICDKNTAKVYKIAKYFGENPKRFPIQMTISTLAGQFIKLLRYHACREQRMSDSEISAELGVNPYFMRDYARYGKNYPVKSCMAAIAILREYDTRSKSNARGSASDGDLLVEVISRLMNR